MELPNIKPRVNEAKTEEKVLEKIETQKKDEKIVTKTVSNIPVNKNVKGILPRTVLSEEDKKKISLKKERLYKITCILKQVATILSISTIFWFFWMQANISRNNKYMSKVGVEKNVGLIAVELENKNMQLEIANLDIDNRIRKFEDKIKNKHYTLFSQDIRDIRESQITWFDKIINSEIELGIMDGVRKIADYLNSSDYNDPKSIINGRHEKVEIDNIKATRETVSFSAQTTQILGRIIFMDIEFVDMLNSFPIYKNGKHLNSFSRDKNDDGDFYSEFSMTLDVQHEGYEDSDDTRFIEYLNWFDKQGKGLKIKKYNK